MAKPKVRHLLKHISSDQRRVRPLASSTAVTDGVLEPGWNADVKKCEKEETLMPKKLCLYKCYLIRKRPNRLQKKRHII